MKKMILALMAGLLAVGLMGAPGDLILSQAKSPGPGNSERQIPMQNALANTLASFQEGIGLGLTDSPQFTGLTLSGLTAGRVAYAGVGGLLSGDADMTFSVDTLSITKINSSGVGTYAGSKIATPATITITANAGPLDITLGDSIATNNANTSITMSALGTTGQKLTLYAVNSDASNLHTWTINNVSGTDPTFTAAANSTTVVTLRSDGTGFSILGGPVTINDLVHTATPASTNLIASQNVTSGATVNSTLAEAVGVAGVIPHSVSFTVTGGGSPLTTGVQDLIVNSKFGGTISTWTVTASPADTITFDILRSAAGGAAPSSSIVGAGTKPNLASGVDGHAAPSSWTSTTVTAYDNFKCQITAVGGTATSATVTLFFQ